MQDVDLTLVALETVIVDWPFVVGGDRELDSDPVQQAAFWIAFEARTLTLPPRDVRATMLTERIFSSEILGLSDIDFAFIVAEVRHFVCTGHGDGVAIDVASEVLIHLMRRDNCDVLDLAVRTLYDDEVHVLLVPFYNNLTTWGSRLQAICDSKAHRAAHTGPDHSEDRGFDSQVP